MIENLVKSFACPACNSGIKETSVEIIWAAGSTVNIDIECPMCKKHALIKAELAYADMGNMNLGKDKLEAVKDILKAMGNKASLEQETTTYPSQPVDVIDDKKIVELSQNLKNKNLSVSDLLKE